MSSDSPAALSTAFARAIAAGDVPAALEMWQPDAAIVQADGAILSGREAVEAALRALIDNGVSLQIELGAVYEAGATALATGTLTMSGSDGNGGGFEHSSDALVVYRRDADGRWRIALDAPWGLPAR